MKAHTIKFGSIVVFAASFFVAITASAQTMPMLQDIKVVRPDPTPVPLVTKIVGSSPVASSVRTSIAILMEAPIPGY